MDNAQNMAQKLVRGFRKRFRDPRTQSVLGFLAGKRLLLAPGVSPTPLLRISLLDAIWVGKNVEPRVIEVLPAAVLFFSKSFSDLERMPVEFKRILSAIRAQEDLTLEYHGVSFSEMKRWAMYSPHDKRVRVVGEKRRPVTFRLSPEAVGKLKALSKELKHDMTEVLERAIMSWQPEQTG